MMLVSAEDTLYIPMVGAARIELATPTMSTERIVPIPLISYGLDFPDIPTVPERFLRKCATDAPRPLWSRPVVLEEMRQPLPPKPTTPCKEWPGRRNKAGYGLVDNKFVHRQVWAAKHGPIPPGMKVLHACDNPPCYAEDHLWLGTQADNMRDMKVKGRDNRAHGGRPFKTGEAIRMRAINDPRPAELIAAELGVHRATVSRWRQRARS